MVSACASRESNETTNMRDCEYKIIDRFKDVVETWRRSREILVENFTLIRLKYELVP